MFSGSSKSNHVKMHLLNSILKDYFLTRDCFKSVSGLSDWTKKAYLQPSTFITYIKCLGSEFKSYRIDISLINDFDFEGGFRLVVKQHIQEIAKYVWFGRS